MDNNNDNNNPELDRLKQILNNKVEEKKNQIHSSHAKVYNGNLQIEICSLRLVVELATNQTQVSQVGYLVEKEINALKRKMKNSIDVEERDVLITEVEILVWVLYVIQSIDEKAEVSNKLII